ncbi:hypothetical protein PQX77_000652 [Marasmius sp. AFHP31]|nr:hypothetical protein PQX77_000652 [Marasmius sp. AFHP31]
MLPSFSLRHIPALFVASTTTFGGFWPLFNAKAAILDFGLPPRVAKSPEAQSVMKCCSARTTVLGTLIFIFYAQNRLDAVDIVLGAMGVWVGLVDGYVCWMEGVPGKAVFRGTAGMAIGMWGLAGLTAGPIP